jgi:hypothetical protein
MAGMGFAFITKTSVMKFFVPAYCLVFLNCILHAQISDMQPEPLKIEWNTVLPVGETDVSGLVLHNNRAYVTLTGGASVFNILDDHGVITFTSLANNTRIRSLFMYDTCLLSIGDQQLTRRSLQGEIISEHTLIWKNGENISSRNGKILNDRVYTTNIHNDFLKYSLTGEQLFRKEIATLTDNHFLDVGGNIIYIYSTITNPAQGSRLLQYDTLGNLNWSVGIGDVYNIIADNMGNCYVLTANGDGTVIKYSMQGQVVWSRSTPGQWSQGSFLKGDSLFVCGNVFPGDTKQSCAYSIISASTGKIISQQTITISENKNEFEHFSKIACDGKNIYIGGQKGNQYQKCFLLILSREGNTIGLKEVTGSQLFNVFPNPSSSKFTITCENSQASTANITVRNISGQVVYKKEISCNADKSFTLDLGKQAAGNYTVEIVSGEEKTVKKIVVE